MWDSRPTVPLAGTGGGWGQTWRVINNNSMVIPYETNWPGNTVPFIPDSTMGDFIVAQYAGDTGTELNPIHDLVIHPDVLPKTAYFDEKRRLTFTGDQRHLVLNQSIGIGGEDRLYRMSVRARDLGGNSAFSVAEGNRFSAGLECLDKSQKIISANNYNDAWGNSHWIVSDHQSIDDAWFTYIGHFKGRQSKKSSDLISYRTENHGSGGRKDLPVAGKSYNSLSRAIDGDVVLPFGTTFIRPTLRINEPSSTATYSQGTMQIDYVQIEELTPIQSQLGFGGEYLDSSSLLSTPGAFLQDNHYRQTYAYDIRSKQQVKTYESIVKSTTHPAGLKMFGTVVSESSRRTSDSIDLVATNLANLTNFEIELAVHPAWSPDGTKIAFRSTRDSATANGDIYYMDAIDGTNVVRVTNDQPATGDNYYPDWSPDGTELVFESRTDDSANGDIYAIKIGGTDLRQLTTNTYLYDTDPTFSPDGKKIAFQRREALGVDIGSIAGIMVMDASDGGNKKLITPMYPYENSPSWSPDGKKIAYRKQFYDADDVLQSVAIWTVDVDGSNPTEIYRPPGIPGGSVTSTRLYYPAWSPDGTKIAVHGKNYDTEHDISVIMNADNPGDVRLVQLTTNAASDAASSWSPDGTKIAFQSNRSDAANNEIWVMDVSHPRTNTNLLGTFSPDSLDSLAGWFKAESISPENVDNLRYTTNVVGTHTATNIMPPGISDFPGTGSPIENHLTLSAIGGRTPFTASIDYGDWAVGSPSSLKIQTPTTASDGSTWLENAIYFGDDTQLDDANIIVPVANTKWLFSCYIKSSNVSPGFHGGSPSADGIFRAYVRLANTSLYGGGGVVDWSGTSGMVSQADTWTRVSAIFDFDSNLINVTSHPADQNSRRALFIMDFGNPNSTYHIDGLMLERYDASLHGATPGSHTPSPYVHPSLNGADVMSWYDSSPNKLHAYANTSTVFGTNWKPPMFLANTGTGHPVVAFRSNNAFQNGTATGNVYHYSTFPNDPNYMTGLTGKTSPAANTLPRPIANQFTGFVVARTNLTANQTNYYTAVWPWMGQQLFEVGSFLNHAHDSGSIIGDGSYGISLLPRPTTGNGALYTMAANSSGYRAIIRTAVDDTSTELQVPLDTSTSFRIFGISEFATTNTYAATQGKTSDLLTMHYNGRRYGNSALHWHDWSFPVLATPDDLSRDGLSYERQIADDATFYIGHAQDGKYSGKYSRYDFFDGDMAEIVWFNEQLSNTQIALVEGYLAHKYGIADDLIHKDGSGDHPYKYQAPPAVGANNTSY